jgi:hypothetical protein
MNTKLLTGMGCLLLLAAAISPGVVGHDERAVSKGSIADGVSGRYIGPTGAAVVPNGDANPADTIGIGYGMLCDAEVAGTGASVFPQDEVRVDGVNTGNLVPDTIDDGGYGGACHTNHYGLLDYNTPGCPATTAHAYDDAGGDVWILASCDWKTTIGGTPSDAIFVSCVANAVLTANVAIIPGCVLAFVACVVAPVSCTVGGSIQCGSDAVADAGNWGHGNGGVSYPRTAFLVDVNGVPQCQDPADATAAVFVFSGVTVDGANSHAHPATTGDVYES